MKQYATNTRHRTPPRARMLCMFPIELVYGLGLGLGLEENGEK